MSRKQQCYLGNKLPTTKLRPTLQNVSFSLSYSRSLFFEGNNILSSENRTLLLRNIIQTISLEQGMQRVKPNSTRQFHAASFSDLSVFLLRETRQAAEFHFTEISFISCHGNFWGRDLHLSTGTHTFWPQSPSIPQRLLILHIRNMLLFLRQAGKYKKCPKLSSSVSHLEFEGQCQTAVAIKNAIFWSMHCWIFNL